MYRILIIEDDFTMAEAMKKQIESWGNEVRLVSDFQNVIHEFIEYDPHMVLIDIMLPFFNGYHWCSEIRKISNIPIIFISSVSDNMNIIMAMNMGADDFIPKPVDLNVMIAKECGGAVLNLNDTTLNWNDQKIELTRNEFRILKTLMENRGKIVSRDTLMTRLWEDDCYVEENTLTVNVTRLRKKLEQAGLKDFITTRVGHGYLIELPEEHE